MSRRVLGSLLLPILLLPACDAGSSAPFTRHTLGFTFEATLLPWETDGADLDDPPVTWSIGRSDAAAESGEWSVRYDLDNLNDAGKIWIETALGGLAPGATYDVTIAFDFGSEDGEVNAWSILVGATDGDPEGIGDLTVLGDTRSPAGAGAFAWDRKEYTTTLSTVDGQAWFAIGVWGTFETARTYFVDDVEIEVVRGS